MDKKEKINLQIEISIFYIIFIFTLISTFPNVKLTTYGVNNWSFWGINFLVYTIYFLFAFIFSSSIYIILKKENNLFYFLSQFFFILSSGLIFLVLILIVSFIPLDIINRFSLFNNIKSNHFIFSKYQRSSKKIVYEKFNRELELINLFSFTDFKHKKD